MSEIVKTGPETFPYSNGNLETVSSGVFQDVRPEGAGAMQVVANAAKSDMSGLNVAQDTRGSGYTAEQFAKAAIANATGDGNARVGVGTRLSGEDATANGYVVIWNKGLLAIQFFALVNGSFNPVAGGDLSTTWSDGEEIKLYTTTSGGDTILEVFKGGISLGTRTDSPTQVAGGAGTRTGIASSNGGVIDDFSGGILGTEDPPGPALRVVQGGLRW